MPDRCCDGSGWRTVPVYTRPDGLALTAEERCPICNPYRPTRQGGTWFPPQETGHLSVCCGAAVYMDRGKARCWGCDQPCDIQPTPKAA